MKLACPECGSTRIQATAWIEINTCEIIDGDPPTDTCYCPDCEDKGQDPIFKLKHAVSVTD